MKNLLLLGLCVTASIVAVNTCRQDPANDLILTGSVSFTNSYGGERQQCFTTKIPFLNIYKKGQAIAAPASFDGFSHERGLDYSVKAGFKNADELTIVYLANDYQSFKKTQVFYLVTARNDMWVGSYIPNIFPFLGCWKNDQRNAILQGKVQGLQNQYSLNAVVFVSGIRTTTSKFNLDLKGITVNPSTGSIQADAFSNAAIEYIEISYIIYSNNVPFQITTHFGNLEIVRQATYGFIGANQITSFQINFLGFAINSRNIPCKGSGCTSTCITPDLCTKLEGQIIDKYCLLCKKGEIVRNYECTKPCGENQVFSYGNCICASGTVLVDGACRKICAENAYYDHKNNCKCLTGYYAESGKCIPVPKCGHYEVLVNNRCECIDGYYRNLQGQCEKRPICGSGQLFDGKSCVCQPYYYRNNFGICVPLPSCGQNQVLNNYYACVCKDDFIRDSQNICRKKCGDYAYLWNGKCECLSGYYRPYSYSTCQQIPKCGHYEKLVNYKCVCDQGYGRYGNDCKKCGENEIVKDEKCVCKPWYVRINNVCVYEQLCGENELSVNNECICRDGFIRNSLRKCVPACNSDEIWTSYGCVCKDRNAIKINGVCSKCPEYSTPNNKKGTCDCIDGYVFEPKWGKCFPDPVCPPYSTKIATTQGFICICSDGYIKADSVCKPCGLNSHPNNEKTECVCDYGFQWEPTWGKCMKPVSPSCPARSTWNPSTLKCECKSNGEYLINNQCRKCGELEGWNGDQCVCKTGYFKIDGYCRTCDPYTTYNGKDCVCNLGYYGNRDKCNSCHFTCGKCNGPSANQCLTCADVSYTFNQGVCSRDTPCPQGLYYSQQYKSCKPCSSYCSSCKSEEVCDTCIDGFQKQVIDYDKIHASYCVEICGDGKRFELGCDDGNKKNKDGCNEVCEVQNGWSCNGGSSVRASTCAPFIPNRTFINPTSAVNLFGKVVHGVRLSYIPKELTQNECASCNKILWIKVIKSDIIPGVRVSFVPKSTYQLYIQFDFHGTFSIPVFTFSIQINPDYQSYFSSEDLAQIKVLTVDPAVLKKGDKVETLTLDDEEDPIHPFGLSEEIQEFLNNEKP